MLPRVHSTGHYTTEGLCTNNAVLLVHFYFVAGTVCKSSAHSATLEMWVILSPLHDV